MIDEISKTCRLCSSDNLEEVIDIGKTTPANNFNDTHEKNNFEKYPLILDFCNDCFNVQLRHIINSEVLYKNYSYLTPNSESLSIHYSKLLEYLELNVENLNKKNVLEIGSNTGELLAFLKDRVNKTLGVDPASNVVEISKDRGIDTICNFFNIEVSNYIKKKYFKYADIVIARHMFAHNPYPQKILKGMEDILSEDGILIIENAYAIETFQKGEFDQIYHEHMFYYSIISMKNLLKRHNLHLNDIFFSSVHGGSIIFVASRNKNESENLLKGIENESFLFKNSLLKEFKEKSFSLKENFLSIIKNEVNAGSVIGAYGAPAKAFTLFSFFELDRKTISFCADTTHTKIGKFFPILDIPVISEKELKERDYSVLIIPAWNYKKDIIKKAKRIFRKGTKLVFPLPSLDIVEVD